MASVPKGKFIIFKKEDKSYVIPLNPPAPKFKPKRRGNKYV